MRSLYLLALVIVVFTAGIYWYRSTATVCPIPISYRLGDVDPSFGISREQALAYVTQAETVWEGRVGQELFSYDEASELVVQFVYDERQEMANQEEEQRATLDEKQQESEKVQQTLESLQAEYATLAASYQERVATYETRLAAYNAEVNKYNDRGGAPPEIFGRLEQERTELNDEAAKLSKLSGQLEEFADKINRLVEKGNELVDTYNEGVNEYNEEFGYAREFTQGDYLTGQITVYKFSSEAEVVTVLAHEFGHALGIGHVEGTSSLMYYLLDNTDERPVLSSQDLQSYEQVCGDKGSFPQRVRRFIREALTII